MKCLRLLALLPAFFFAQDAAAQTRKACCRGEPPRWYVGLAGAAVFLKDTDISHPGFTVPGGRDGQTYDTGFGVIGSVGYRVFPNIRLEFEASYRANEVASDPGVTTPQGNGSSEQRSLAFMGNVYYDWHNSTLLTPYLGAGAGQVRVKNPRYYTSGNQPVTKPLSAWTLGYQFMAGINYEIDQGFTPMEITLGYRYFSGQDAETDQLNTTISWPNDSHNIELGGRMFF